MYKHLFVFISLFPFFSYAQETKLLSYEKAIELALQNNFDIQLAKNASKQTSIQNTYGAAGFLPDLDILANTGAANNSTRQEFSNGLIVDKNGVSSSTLNAGAYLSWTIFDGMKMFATKQKLNLLQEQGELSLKITIENTIEKVTLAYYQIVKQEQLIRGILKARALTELRLKIAQKKIEVGSGSKVEMLQAQMDLNAQKSNLIAQENLLNTYTYELNLLLKNETNQLFVVDSLFLFDSLQTFDDLRNKVSNANTSLLLVQRNKDMQKQTIQEIRANQLPKVGLSANYLFGRNENEAGFSLLNQNLGYQFGLNLSWKLFSGFTTQNQLKVAKLNYLNTALEVDKTSAILSAAVTIAYRWWAGNIEIVSLEEDNILLANENLKISAERLKLGLANYLEIKESENSYELAINRLVNARYNLKEAETNLKKLSGMLLK
jgi:outer membrane protein